MSESQPVHDAGTRESEWEGHPDADYPPFQYEAEEVACGQSDDEVGNKGNHHHDFYIRYAPQCVGKVYLQSVAELIKQKWDDERSYHHRYFSVVGKPSAHFVAEQKDERRHDNAAD